MAGAHENDGNTPDDLPDLPEEWGVIVIPDDLSELSDEVEAIRAELRQSERSHRWRRLFDRPGLRQLRDAGLALLRAPVLIISMAVLVTVASLFASAWPGPPRQPVVQRTNDDHPDALPALELTGDDGHLVPLRSRLPAVILVTDGCDCSALISATAAAARDLPQIKIIVIAAALSSAANNATGAANNATAAATGTTSPNSTTGAANSTASAAGNTTTAANSTASAASNTTSAAKSTTGAESTTGANGTTAANSTTSTRATPATQTTPQATAIAQAVEVLHNTPGHNVRDQLKLGQPDGTAAALLVDRTGKIVYQIPRTLSVDDIQPSLARI